VSVEGEGELPVEGEGEVPAEGEGELPVEGEGEIPVEGEGETPAEGEGEIYYGPWYVDVDNTSGVYDGLSWETAFTAIQQGSVAAVAGGGDVWVAEGTYCPPITMFPGVHLYGGFAGNETERDQRDWNAHPTVISGGTPCVTSADNATLDGFSVTAGIPGMTIDSGVPVIRNCVFEDNVVYGEAPDPPCPSSFVCSPGESVTNWALVISGGAPEIENCIFSGNGAIGGMGGTGDGSGWCYHLSGGRGGDAGGGGVYIAPSGAGTFTNCVFNQNFAYPGGGGWFTCSLYCGCGVPGESGTVLDAGAIWFAGTALSAVNCTFMNNTRGIVNASSHQADIVNSIVWTPGISTISTGATAITYSDVIDGYAGEGNISADPLFVNPGGDLRLSEGSPCIDLASEVAAPGADLLGVVRPQGAGPDMGAYEFLSEGEGEVEGEPEGEIEGEFEGEGEGEMPPEGEGEPEGEIEGEGEDEPQPIATLFNTGVDNSGALLPDDFVDPHYIITVGADPVWNGPEAYASSEVPTAWNLSGSDSRWITPGIRFPLWSPVIIGIRSLLI